MMHQKWEYFVYTCNASEGNKALITYGEKGWELASVIHEKNRGVIDLYFKRPLIEEEK